MYVSWKRHTYHMKSSMFIPCMIIFLSSISIVYYVYTYIYIYMYIFGEVNRGASLGCYTIHYWMTWSKLSVLVNQLTCIILMNLLFKPRYVKVLLLVTDCNIFVLLLNHYVNIVNFKVFKFLCQLFSQIPTCEQENLI